MTASERLRVLKMQDSPESLVLYCAALPLIADLVEAAERAREYADTGYSNKAGGVLRREVGPALRALRDALEPEEALGEAWRDRDAPEPDFWRPTGQCPEC